MSYTKGAVEAAKASAAAAECDQENPGSSKCKHPSFFGEDLPVVRDCSCHSYCQMDEASEGPPCPRTACMMLPVTELWWCAGGCGAVGYGGPPPQCKCLDREWEVFVRDRSEKAPVAEKGGQQK